MNCFKCLKNLTVTECGPLDGVSFSTYGNYGSSVIDDAWSSDATSHRIVICDECLKQGANLVELYRYKTNPEWSPIGTLQDRLEFNDKIKNQIPELKELWNE
jgi:hypothetical protein